ncbi:Methyltransferase-like protein 6 [Senna tora]|uniref:Methyltransferase-like protein 6 n=1 Tax=Senna tora TaxID=362788 RepID=A0A834WQU1_9FABA|nr:Methyltransferase-like protein 6 [Senna tora]
MLAEKYERGAKRYWDEFYKRHQDKVGCGAGNTIFPVIASYPDVFVYACDFSSRAIELVKMHKGFKESCVSVFVSDLTADDLCKEISPSSVDIVTMPNGYVLFRDYAAGDLAQEKLSGKAQKINDNFYVRGDGTVSFQ